VLEAVASLYPSPIYTLVKNEKLLSASFLKDQTIQTSFIQKLPRAAKWYRNYLPFFPLAIEQFDLSGYDLILSSSHAVAKGVLTQPHQLHICYCHTPLRYAWDLYHHYLKDLWGIRKKGARWILHYLRNWDIGSLNRVDHFVANSHFVAKRIKKIYGKEAAVIYPPVATHLFHPREKKDDFYLTVSRLVPYKKIDLIVEAFSQMPDKKLIVIGEGSELAKIRKQAKKNIEFLGFQPDSVVREYMEKARGFLFAAEDDFGIAPVEAQAAGTAVIAFARGGALETVSPDTGEFFEEQSASSLIEAVHRFERRVFDPGRLRGHAERFNEERFKKEFKQFTEHKWEAFCEDHRTCRR